jgi:SMC interacting uncharacterized protein involved in chromosome segregation
MNTDDNVDYKVQASKPSIQNNPLTFMLGFFLVILVGSLLLNLSLTRRVNSLEEQNLKLQTDINNLNTNFNTLQNNYKSLQLQLTTTPKP